MTVSYAITLACDDCSERIATGRHTREAYDLARAVGAVVYPAYIFCARCAVNWTPPLIEVA